MKEAVSKAVDRMWVIVRSRDEGRFSGVLDSDPGLADRLKLRPGQDIHFGPEHIVKIDRPPRAYVLEKYGANFFSDGDAG